VTTMRTLRYPIAMFIVAVLAVIGIGVAVSASTWNQEPQFHNKVVPLRQPVRSLRLPVGLVRQDLPRHLKF